MIPLLQYFVGWLVDAFRSREDLILENLALRQQLLALHAKRTRRRLGSLDRVFWVALREQWSGWRRSLVIVTPETVVRWHRTGFRLYWGWLSRTRRIAGRKPFSREVRDLIFRMVAENPTWGAPRIHGELRVFRNRILIARLPKAAHSRRPTRRSKSWKRGSERSSSKRGSTFRYIIH